MVRQFFCFINLRWAVEYQSILRDSPVVRVVVFWDEAGRDSWVNQNRARRAAVGKRHPAVKAYRRRVSGRTNV